MSNITLPGLMLGASESNSSGTSGRNPWVDGIFYEAQWGNAFHTAFQLGTPTYDYYFLRPFDIKKNDSNQDFAAKINGKYVDRWHENDGIQGIEPPHRNSSTVFKKSFETVADVSNLQFREVKKFNKANIVIANAHLQGFQGSHESLINSRTGEPSSLPLIFDYDYNTYNQDIGRGKAQPGSPLRVVLIHELGHGLGLSHPHDSGLGFLASGVFPGLVPSDTNGNYGNGLQGLTQQPYTILSYKRGYTNPTITDAEEQSNDNVATPMALDVAALQIKYGTNRKTRKGNTTYNLNPNYWQCIYDAGGEDWIKAKTLSDATGNPLDAIINLRPAEMNAVRPSDGSPMESYRFGHGKAFDIALNTLISQNTSMIGAPLGMGLVAADKIDQVLSNETTLRRFKEEGHFQTFKELGKRLQLLQIDGISPLQITTAIQQTNFREYPYIQKTGLPTKFHETIGSLINNSELFDAIINGGDSPEAKILQDSFYKASFIDPENPSDLKKLEQDIASFEANSKAEQQRIMTRSFNGIGGYPMFYAGKNGGLTIAAGVLIENAQGGNGNDMITGNAEDNILKGGRGDDVLDGYIGSDTLYGGPGSDTFSYENIEDSPAEKHSKRGDSIIDFSQEDRISLKPFRVLLNSSWDPRLKAIKDQYQLKYLDSKPFDGKEGRIRFENEELTIDTDGDMTADMLIKMPGVATLNRSQLLL